MRKDGRLQKVAAPVTLPALQLAELKATVSGALSRFACGEISTDQLVAFLAQMGVELRGRWGTGCTQQSRPLFVLDSSRLWTVWPGMCMPSQTSLSPHMKPPVCAHGVSADVPTRSASCLACCQNAA